jgi:hypothetical protein
MENEKKINDLENRLSALESQLKAALRSDDTLESPQSIRHSLVSAFRSEMRKYTFLTWGFLIFFTACAVGCFIAFDMAPTTKNQLMCITFFNIMILGTVLIKLWYWLVWNRYSVVREVKRLELRIAELVEKLDKRETHEKN